MIPSQIIEEIRSKADIVAVISEYIKLKKRGKNHLGLCPFHSEKDPSFTVSPEKQLFHCFGCNEGGNVFTFIMKIENIGFAEAVEELGAKVGVSVPKSTAGSAGREENDRLYQIMLLASKFFEGQFGEAAKDYLKKRGIPDKTIKLFSLGFAPAGWDQLFKYLISRGAAPKLIEKSGLILARESQEGFYDRFRNRLIFPIVDHRHRVIAFGGRSLGDEEPKYLNSPDTLIYHKGETLFGLNLSKDEIKKCKTAILVEGYFDLITPFQAGIKNMVASLGTALTPLQCKLLARYCDTVVLAFDADSAGGAAAERSVELLRNQGLKVKVAKLSSGKDPDELIQKEGAKAFIECLNAALPFLEFKIERIISRHNLGEIEARASALCEIARLLSQVQDDFTQKEYAKTTAKLLKTDADTVLSEIKRMRHYTSMSKNPSHRTTEKPGSKTIEAEKNIIALAAQSPEALDFVKKEMKAGDFLLPETHAIAETLFTADFSKSKSPAHLLLENLPDEGAKKLLSKLLMSEHLLLEKKSQEILKDCIKTIRDEQAKRNHAALKLRIKEAEKAGETEEVARLLQNISVQGEISCGDAR